MESLHECYFCSELIDTLNGDDEAVYKDSYCHASCLEELSEDNQQ